MSAELVTGMYRASVANNADPLNEARVTLLIPQILGNAESAWAVPASPTNTVPPVGQTVWVQFSGGDITKPVYNPLGIKDVQDQLDTGQVDAMPPKQPTALGLSTVQSLTSEGATQASVTATWIPPTENQDGTQLNDLSHFVVQSSYDNSNWSSGGVTQDVLIVFNGLRTGVNFFVRVQAVDFSGNVSLWSTANIQTASSTTPPPVPSTPTVVGALGGLRIGWDGLDNTGAHMPSIFDHVQVQRDVSSAFNSPTVVATLRGADFIYDSVQNYGNSYYYRLVSYSRVGIASSPSGSASDTPKQAGTGDLAENSVTANQIAAGQVDAEHLTATAIDGKVITGAIVRSVRPDGSVAAIMAPDLGDGTSGFQTNADDGMTFARLEAGQLRFGAFGVDQVIPTGITGKAVGGTLDVQSGVISGGAQAHIIVASGDSPLAPGNGAPFISLEWDGESGPSGADMEVDIGAILKPRSMAWGRVTVNVTTANQPASVTVTGLNVRGTNFEGQATALATNPGSVVTGVSINSITSTSAIVYANRSSAGSVIVSYFIIGDQ
ncbi:phage baseplate assembly protein V [Streptomyces sp. MI02-2A]|uniref:phage baseplate assembly protein V n=1 Tax=Streptomyces sp. MI02-2A TaxID=3028688 RepID=UPI0029AAEEC0|nr:phage baseplate assembly protein V [Streptomyces sp. MI02-2A]MDX3260703.1 phage baseplate assembly protein V [Streptomyces sp. MI02-2A]